MTLLSSSSFPRAPLRVCLAHVWGLAYGTSPGLGDRLLPLVQVTVGSVSIPAIVSTLHKRCWFNAQYGQLAGFVPPNLGKEITVLGKRAFEQEIELQIIGIGAIRTIAVMSDALPEGCFPILGEKAREAMNFSIVENLSDYPSEFAELGLGPKKRIFFGGPLLRRTGDCPYF